MSISTNVIFLRDKENEEHQKKVTVLKACLTANVSLPPEIDKYFGGTNNEDYPFQTSCDAAVNEWFGEGCDGWDVNIDKIPEGIKTIRFRNLW